MNTLQRFAVRLAARVAPPLRHALEQAGGTIENLQERNLMLREQLDDRRQLIASEIRDYQEAIFLAGGGWTPRSAHGVPISESAKDPKSTDSTAIVQCKERLIELELALEDRGWKRLEAQAQYEFSRWGIQQIMLICRLYRIKNPIIQRGILVSTYYVWGRGFEISCDDDAANEVLQAFLTDPRNKNEIGASALMQKEAAKYTDGNIFWCFFSDPSDGSTLIRTIDPIEMDDIITDPDDSSVPWYYRRRWLEMKFDLKTGTQQSNPREAWYVALGYTPPNGTKTIGDIPIMTDSRGVFVPVYHRKESALEKWKFGCPRAYAALDWARAYRQRLEDYSSITRALARFAWNLETKGGPPAMAAHKQALATTLANNLNMIDYNPPATTGSTWISGPGTKMSPINTAGKTPPPEEGRRLAHMAYMVFGLPETFFSDVTTGALATATSLDRPTELKFIADQSLWEEDFKVICGEVLNRSRTAPKGRLREAAKAKSDVKITVKFPAIIEGDIPQRVSAIVESMTLNGFESTGIDKYTGVEMLLNELKAFGGEFDIADIITAMKAEDAAQEKADAKAAADAAKAAASAPQLAPGTPKPAAEPLPTQGAPPVAPKARTPRPKRIGTKESMVKSALGGLKQALQRMKEKSK